jgi:carbon-monoxide dehydrogenase large subunit
MNDPVRTPEPPRMEDARFLSGEGHYVGNVVKPGMLHMKFVRSPHAHAVIRAIDVTAAASMPGVIAVHTGAELRGELHPMPSAEIPGLHVPVHYALAVDRVHLVGEPVAVVVATSLAIASDAADLVEIEYEQLPAVVDPERAVVEGAPLVHEEFGTNVAFELVIGGPGAAFDAADVVVRQRMVNQRLIPSAMEPRGVVADYQRADGTLVMHLSTQAPHVVRSVIAGVLDLPENRIRIIAGDVGGAFGAKLNIYPEDVLAAVLSRKHGRPVKWIEQRSESMVATSHGRALIAEMQVAAMADGTITGLHISVLSDIGAHFGPIPPFGGLLSCQMISGCYGIPEITFDFKVVFTNKTPVEPYRGYYRAEASYFIERLVDLVAAELGMDPVEIRRRNFITAAQFPFRTATGELYDSGDFGAALDTALALAGYDELREEQHRLRAEGRYIGIGISSYLWRASFPSKGMAMTPTIDFLPAGWESASVRVERSGGVTIRTGASPHGQGLGNALAAIVEEQLGVPRRDITVFAGDTDVAPYGIGSEGSRALVTAGSAMHIAAQRVREKATALAAHHLEAAVEDMEWNGSTVSVRGVPTKSFELYDLARIASQGSHRPEGMEPGLEAWASFDPEDFNYPSGVQISVVEVDPHTGFVTVLEQVAVDDCGRRISPMIVEGQVHGGTAQGIGQALFEEATYDDDGQLLSGSFLTYGIPSAPDLPSFDTQALETLTDRNPLGAKGAGEAGTIGAPPAVVNAVVDALAPFGIRHLDMPVTPERIWRALSQPSPSPSPS